MKKKLSLSPWCCLLAWVLLERAEMPLFCVLCAFACGRPPWVSFCPCRACFGVVAFLHACFIVYTVYSLVIIWAFCWVVTAVSIVQNVSVYVCKYKHFF